MRSGSPGRSGRWPSYWTRLRNSARSATGKPKLRPPSVRPCGNGNAKRSGSGA